jgi:gliding motility-associated lipoprotein GldH
LKRRYYNYLVLVAVFSLQLISCTTVDLFEKSAVIPKYEWHKSFKPEFTFLIRDTGAVYQVFLVLRHNERYNYNNIWLNVYTQAPGDSVQQFRIEKTLATNEKGWLATGMDDIYEHRLPLPLPEFRITKPGEYKFVLEHIMREDPLLNVMNVGIRVEKKL